MSEMLAQMLASAGGGQGAPPPDQGDGGDPLGYLQECVQGIHHLISELPDPGHTQMATQALALLTKIQRDLMSQQGGPSMAGRLGGAPSS